MLFKYGEFIMHVNLNFFLGLKVFYSVLYGVLLLSLPNVSWSNNYKLIAFGDSITRGFGDGGGKEICDQSDKGYPPRLSQLLYGRKDAIANEGACSDTVTGGLNKIVGILNKSTYSDVTHVLILFGTNDAKIEKDKGSITSVAIDSYSEGMQAIIDAVRRTGREPLIAKIPPRLSSSYNENIDGYNNAIENLIKTNRLGLRSTSIGKGYSCYFTPPDLYSYFEKPSLFYKDHLHPNHKGYEGIAQLWFEALVDHQCGDPVIPLAHWYVVGGSIYQLATGYDQIEQFSTVYAASRPSGNLMSYEGKPHAWRNLGNIAWHQIVAGPAGRLYALSLDRKKIYEFTGEKFVPLKEFGRKVDRLYASSGGLFVTDETAGDLFEYNRVNLSWKKIGGSGREFVVNSIGKPYGISPNGKGVYEYLGTPGHWRRIWNYATHLYMGGKSLFATGSNGKIYKYNGVPFSWVLIGGSGKTFAVSASGKLYGLSSDGSGIYRWSGIPEKWYQIGGAADSIQVAGEHLFAVIKSKQQLIHYREGVSH